MTCLDDERIVHQTERLYAGLTQYFQIEGINTVVLVVGLGRSGSTSIGRTLGRALHPNKSWWYQPGKAKLREKNSSAQGKLTQTNLGTGANSGGVVVIKESICFTKQESQFNPLVFYKELFGSEFDIRVVLTLRDLSSMLESWIRTFIVSDITENQLVSNFHTAFETFCQIQQTLTKSNMPHTLFHPFLIHPGFGRQPHEVVGKLLSDINIPIPDKSLYFATNWNQYDQYASYTNASGIIIPSEPATNLTVNPTAMRRLLSSSGLVFMQDSPEPPNIRVTGSELKLYEDLLNEYGILQGLLV